MKQEFLDFVNALMNANPKLTDELMTESVKAYLNILAEVKEEKPLITEDEAAFTMANEQKSKDIAEQLGLASRSVSGTMRKLVNDGFCDKIGKDPIVYTLTEKGKNFVIEKE